MKYSELTEKDKVLDPVEEIESMSNDIEEIESAFGPIEVRANLPDVPEITFDPYEIRVLMNTQCYEGPSSDYQKTFRAKIGDTFTIIDELILGKRVWGKIKGGPGWILLNFCKKVEK